LSLPSRGVAYVFYVSLIDASDTTQFLAAPTIASGDVKVSKEGGAEANLSTLPVVANKQVAVSLSASEMDAASVTVEFKDQTSPEEWLPLRAIIPTI
jgi:hypothetical protein